MSDPITKKFNTGKFGPGEKLEIQKFQRDFKRVDYENIQIFDIYVGQIQKHKRNKERDLNYHRESYRKCMVNII